MNRSAQSIQGKRSSYLPSLLLVLIVLVSANFFAACGMNSGMSQMKTAAMIAAAPTNQSSRVGQMATFTVMASGTAPISYQWSENGAAIPGATSAVYNTPVLAPTDNGETFTVTVSNSLGSASSNPASLTVGPRAPQAGDLRFQQVDAPSTSSGLTTGGLFTTLSDGGLGFGNSVGTPITAGDSCGAGDMPLDCAWGIETFPLPAGVSGLKTNYFAANDFSDLGSDLDNLTLQDTVITSIDLEPANNTYAISSIETIQTGGFTLTQQSIPSAQVQSLATQLGQQSQVITALSFDASGNAFILSYAWQSDITTIYESQVVAATLDGIPTAATNLAAAGYIITALGGDSANGYLVVGTRVQGDTMPRPMLVVNPKTGLDLDPLFASGDAVVGFVFNPATPTPLQITWIAEQ